MWEAQVVLDVITRWDPIRLVPLGVPDDEYEPEARMILAEVRKVPPASVQELAAVVHKVFLHMFGDDTFGSTETDCIPVAEELWRAPRSS